MPLTGCKTCIAQHHHMLHKVVCMVLHGLYSINGIGGSYHCLTKLTVVNTNKNTLVKNNLSLQFKTPHRSSRQEVELTLENISKLKLSCKES